MHVVFYGEKYAQASEGAMGMYYDEVTGEVVDFDDIGRELATGQEVYIRPATVADTHHMEALLAILKARKAAIATEMSAAIDQLNKSIDLILGAALPRAGEEGQIGISHTGEPKSRAANQQGGDDAN